MRKKNIVIELRGVEFVNKGAELMLMTILKLLRDRYGDTVQIVMERNKRVPISKLKENSIYVKFFFRKFGIKWEEIGRFFPFLLKPMGFILPNKIDIIMDGSGFAFGDQWGANYARHRIANFLSLWKRNNSKIILLPQAFGPFEDIDLREVMADVIEGVDLIFAREEQSYGYLTAVKLSDKIKLAPDFTNLIKGYVPEDFNRQENRIAIVPNYKMIEQRLSESDYLHFLCEIAQHLKAKGDKPFFLIHEGSKDRTIAEKANELIREKINIIDYQDPLAVKGIIGQCDFIICSRFHGVVSALSQAVPCIATSWSHKYEMLMKEYGVEYSVVSDLTNVEDVLEKINFLLLEDNRENVSKLLLDAGSFQRKRSKKTWDQIFSFIDKKIEKWYPS